MVPFGIVASPFHGLQALFTLGTVSVSMFPAYRLKQMGCGWGVPVSLLWTFRERELSGLIADGPAELVSRAVTEEYLSPLSL